MGVDDTINCGREQESERVAFLQKPGNKSPPFRRHGFHRQRGTDAPLAPHTDAVEQAQAKENLVARSKPGENFNH